MKESIRKCDDSIHKGLDALRNSSMFIHAAMTAANGERALHLNSILKALEEIENMLEKEVQ